MIIDYTLSLAEYLTKQKLQHLILHVTNNCNYRCDHCFIDFSPKRDMTLAQYQDLAKQVGKLFWLDIAGGEPFLRLDLAEIIAAFDFKVVQIPSNGSLCDRMVDQLQKLKQLTKAEITISLSVDGLEETHDRIRHQKGSWQQIWKTLEAIKSLGGISVKINSVLNAENAHEIIDLMKVVRKYEPDFHSIILLRGDPMNPSLGLPTMAELHRLAPAIFDILETYDYGRNKIAARILRNYHRYLWKTSLQTIEQQTQVIPCLAGLAHQVVWGDGRVSPCEMLDPVGSLQTQTLKEITSSPAWQQQLEDIKAKKCHCTHNCAMFDSIFFNPANFPPFSCGLDCMNDANQVDLKCCIVIPYKDNSPILARCLTSVLSSVPATTLIVVVDDGSQVSGKADRNLTDFLCDRRLHLLQHSENLGAGAARNTALQWCYEQEIEIAILLDSDCSVTTGFVETHCSLHAQYPEVAVFGGAVNGVGDGIWATLDNLMSWFTSIPHTPLRDVDGLYHIPTTNMSLKLNVLSQESPLFDAHLRTGEDVQFVQRLRRAGYKLMFSPQPEISHYDRQSFADFLAHQYRWGLHTFILRFPQFQHHKLVRFLLIILFVLLLPVFAIAASIITILPWLRQSLKYWWYFPMILCVYLYKGLAVIAGTYNPQLATNQKKF